MKKKKISFIMYGIFLIAISLWGGAYLLHIVPTRDWSETPIVLTSILLFFGGVALAIQGFDS
jgi:uncharacterized protein with PQ loop repeat